MQDDLGDRMKAYEATETVRRLDASMPVYARIDGRSFSRFTRGLRRPFDERMSRAMIATASALIEETNARIAYTQSDEISLVWMAGDEAGSQIFFDGKLLKMASVLASFATAAFTQSVLRSDEEFAAYADRRPHFDARVFQLPSKEEAANAFLWREKDASRNAIQMVAYDRFSAKRLHGVGTSAVESMLEAEGCPMSSFPAFFRFGTFLKRRLVQRALTSAERERIPERHRPAIDALVTRHEIIAMQMPRGLSCEARTAIIFDGYDEARLAAAA